MNRSIIRRVFAGAILGVAIFFIPFFLLKVAAFFIITGTLARFFIRRKIRQFFGGRGFQPAFTDSLRTMNDEEYLSLKRRAQYSRSKAGSTSIDSIEIK